MEKDEKKKERCQRKNRIMRKKSRNRIKEKKIYLFFCENRHIFFG